jgi:histidinol phosphatase-like PHP family hydrolase
MDTKAYRLHDYHTHNGYYRGTGEEWTYSEGWTKAQTLGIQKFGIADKVEFNHPNQDFIPILAAERDNCANPNLLLGIEIDIGHPSGKIVLDQQMLPYLDYVIAGPHNQPVQTLMWSDLDDEDREEYFSSYRDILVNSFLQGPIDIWAHPFLQEIENCGDRYLPQLLPIFQEMLNVCQKKNTALEINENYFRRKNRPEKNKLWWHSDPEYYASKYHILDKLFTFALHETDISFSFASDTHKLSNVGDIRQSIEFAQHIEIPSSRILNLVSNRFNK